MFLVTESTLQATKEERLLFINSATDPLIYNVVLPVRYASAGVAGSLWDLISGPIHEMELTPETA